MSYSDMCDSSLSHQRGNEVVKSTKQWISTLATKFQSQALLATDGNNAGDLGEKAKSISWANKYEARLDRIFPITYSFSVYFQTLCDRTIHCTTESACRNC